MWTVGLGCFTCNGRKCDGADVTNHSHMGSRSIIQDGTIFEGHNWNCPAGLVINHY